MTLSPALPAQRSKPAIGEDWATYCGTCNRALHIRLSPAGRIGYAHSYSATVAGLADHPPHPVPLSELPAPVMECDICSSEPVAWIYVCEDQTTDNRTLTARHVGAGDYQARHHAARTRRVQTELVRTDNWGQRWAACPPSAEAIEADNLLGLIARGTAGMPPKVVRGKRLITVRAQLHQLYSTLLDTRHPGREPVTGAPTTTSTPPPGR
ncbi:hypothetical protein [Pilimelia terevasa]|uniref:hypothetical protein n=1 Tax=Pilimelia terevasa TaxID=53372 RepID=UPI00166D19FD|nr:hypothetical protein [Pilimelia terevasa]